MEFKEKKIVENIIIFIREYYQKNHLKGVVIGISGGKDSAVVATLFTKALGSNNVEGIWMPCHSSKNDYQDAKDLCKFLNINLNEFDLTNLYDEYVKNIRINNNVQDNDLIDANINIKPRLRMSTLYYYASMFSKIKKGIYLVAGTSNASEIYVGYFTKGGDNTSDIDVLSDFTVSEVIKIGEYLGIPDKIIHKIPSDGLSGMSDEEKLGISYHDIDLYLRNKKGLKDKNVKDKIIKMHQNNLHKFRRNRFINNQKTLGIYIGSFNPPHRGHHNVIKHLINHKIVDKILIVPTGNYWDKTDLIDINHRINMLKYWENSKVKVDSSNNHYQYTYELMQALEKQYANYNLALIIGADNIVHFNKWKNYQELLKYPLIIMQRDNINVLEYIKKYGVDNYEIINKYPYVKISSTNIRNNLNNKYLDNKIIKYINDNDLYMENNNEEN